MGGDRLFMASALVALILASVAAQALGSVPTPPAEESGFEAGPLIDDPLVDSWWLDSARLGGPSRIDPALLRIESEGFEAALAQSGRPHYAVEATPEGLRFNVFVRFFEEPDAAKLQALQQVAAVPMTSFPLAEAVHVRGVSFQQATSLLQVPGVAGVELERSVVPFLDMAGANALVVGHENLGPGARERWKAEGRDAVIAVLDTGIDKEHEVFEPERYVGGYDATVPTGRVGDELLDSQAPTWTPLNEREPDDDYYADEGRFAHGTHMASIAFGHDPNGTYTGMAPAARFMDVKVISNLTAGIGMAGGPSQIPYGWGSYVLEGMEFVHRYNNGESHLGDPGRHTVDVALMALGETEPDLDGTGVLSHAANRLVATGVSVVAAAGNCGPNGDPECAGHNNTIVAPGAAERAITVGSMVHNGTVGPWIHDDEKDIWSWDETLSGFSSRGPNGGEPKPNLVTYGEGIRAAQGEPDRLEAASNEYRNGSGTSQAAAQIAGIVALMLEVDEDMKPDEVKRVLMGTARESGPRGWDERYGAGVVNALFAVGVSLDVLDMKTTIIDERGQDAGDRLQNEEPEEEEKPRTANQAPVSRFHYRPGAPVVGESVVFIDRSMDPDGEDLVSLRWDFGDGNTGKGARAAHVYEKPGEYRVVLTVTDVQGTAGSWDTTVRVEPDPEVEESPVGGVLWLLAAITGGVVALRRAQKGVD